MGSVPSITLKIIFIIAFYFQANIAGMIGIHRNLVVYVLLVLCSFEFIAKGKRHKKSPEILILFGIMVMLLYRITMSIFSGAFISALFIALPALILYITPQQDKQGEKVNAWLLNFIVTFYLIECGIAIFEFATDHYLFGFSENTYSDGKWHFTSTATDFRAVSICGSPLQNALIVVIINAFILFSSLPNRKKVLCFMFGLLAVFAFNARTSTVLFILTGVFYVVRRFGLQGGLQNLRLLSIAVMLALLAFISVFYWGLGSRLLATDMEEDGSIDVRLQLFEYFETASLNDYLWGRSMDGFVDEKDYIGVPVIENFWIEYMMLFGLIPLLYFTVCYFRLGKKLYAGNGIYAKWVTAIIFIVNASINNSMSTSYSPLLTFLLCIVAFKYKHKADVGVGKEIITPQ